MTYNIAGHDELIHGDHARRIAEAIQRFHPDIVALQEADAQGISGKESTPFLLARVCELTGGNSLAANIQLVLNNARLAAAIARDYCLQSA